MDGILRTIYPLSVTLFLVTSSIAETRSTKIQFEYRPIPFVLENGETPQKHAPETMAGGVAVFDYDGDGDLDIYFANGAKMPSLDKDELKYWNRLFANDGNAQFTDVTAKAGVQGVGFSTGVATGDYDADGDIDLFLAGVHRYILYRNNGDGTFADVTVEVGLNANDPEKGPLWAVDAAWLDYDNDSHLDLFVVNYLVWDPETEPTCADYCHPKVYDGSANRLYHNNGDGTFSDVSASSGIQAYVGKGMGAAIADYDKDGLLDIFVTNDKAFNFFFRNRGDGTFEESAFEVGVALPEHGKYVSGMGADFRDFDNDALPDIVYVALEHETFPLYRNTGEGDFEEITLSSGMQDDSRLISGYSPLLADFDNDGWKDLFVSCGHVQSMVEIGGVMRVENHNSVFRNLGNGKLDLLVESAGLAAQEPRRHRGAAFGDLDGDGRLDVVVTALAAEAEIWINRSPGRQHWLELRLEGTDSNRSAVGAEVRLYTDAGLRYDHVTTSVGYASSSAGPLHFGLGGEPSVKHVEIRWPSGRTTDLYDVKADQMLRLSEPPSRQDIAGSSMTTSGTR